MNLDFRVVELLFSRMCHDLVGPVGAAVNGVELLEEFGGEMADEAITLLGSSARVASRRLRVYRVAYGMAAGAAISSLGDLRSLITEFLDGGKITLEWPDNKMPAVHVGRNAIKCILNMSICAAETLPRGGALHVGVEQTGADMVVTMQAKGQGARLAEGVAEAMGLNVSSERLDPRTVHSYFTAIIGKNFGGGLKFEEGTDVVTLSCRVSAE
jgi:histidine phosphotransferase ChpT